MNSPLLDAFKSLREVSDEVVAREKRIIKEDLEESDFKADEDIIEAEFAPIENSFTASHLWEGLDDETLDEEILDEKLPKDLAQAYRRADQYRVGFEGGDKNRRQSMVDYEAANYEEITPEQALQAKKDGRIQDLRILKDGTLIVYREDGYPLTGIEWVNREDRFINRNGKEVKDTRLMPLSHVLKIADKIYLTDEKEHRFKSGTYQKDENGEYVYVPSDDPISIRRTQARQDDIADTGKHDHSNYSSEKEIQRYTRYASEQDEYIKKYQDKLAELDKKWEEGDISRNEYEKQKASLESSMAYAQKYKDEYSKNAQDIKNRKANQKAEDRFALSRKTLQQNIDKYKELKSSIKSAEWDLKYLKDKGGLSSWEFKGGSYDEKVKKIEALKKQMEEIQKEIDKLQSQATDELKQSNIDQNAKKLQDAEDKVKGFKDELDALLSRAHKASGKEESLQEAMVNLNDPQEAEEEKEKLDSEKDEVPTEQVVDPSATIVDDLKDSYIGYAILSCPTCKEWHYVKPEELVKAEEATKDGTFLYNVEEECSKCGATGGFELVGQVAKLDDEEVEEEKTEEKTEEEPVESTEVEDKEVEVKEEEKEEIKEEGLKEDLTDFDEVSFDSHITKYLKEVYDNVESYTSVDGSLTDEGIIIEGLIKFNSGKEKSTTFKLALEDNTKITGLNEAFDKDNKIYTIEGKIENNCFITDNIIYKYNIGDQLVEGCTKVEEGAFADRAREMDEKEQDIQMVVCDLWSKFSNESRQSIYDLVANLKQDFPELDYDGLREKADTAIANGTWEDYLDTGSISYLKDSLEESCSDKELVDLLVAHGSCESEEEAEQRVAKMTNETKAEMCKTLKAKSQDNLIND